jgi:hypothetical protein
VKFLAKPRYEYISARVCCQKFFGTPRPREGQVLSAAQIPSPQLRSSCFNLGFPKVDGDILSGRDGPANQTISDIFVKNFFTKENQKGNPKSPQGR